MDDFDTEVTRLGSEEGTPQSQFEERDTGLQLGDIPTPSSRRLTTRQRLLRGFGAATIALLAVAVLLASQPGTQRTLAAVFASPTPTATPPLPDSADTFYWKHSVPWGSLVVDGRVGPDLANMTVSPRLVPPVPFFTLARGRHVLEYDADPFPPLRCIVSVPAARSDTCPLAAISPGDPLIKAPTNSRVLDFHATPDHLPSAESDALTQAIEKALGSSSASETVEAGERFATANGSTSVATEQMQAIPVATVNTDPQNPVHMPTGLCVALCVDPPTIIGPMSWSLSVNVVVHWRYLHADGQVALDAGATAPVSADEHLLVKVNAGRINGQWAVQAPSSGIVEGSVTCSVAMPMMIHLVGSAQPSSPQNAYVWVPYTLRSREPVPDCLLVGVKTIDPKGHPLGSQVLVLYRFGLFLAANDAAVALFPDMPVANQLEQSLARQMAPAVIAG